MSRTGLPPYFDALLEGYRRGLIGRSVHLGHWDAGDADGFEPAQARLDRAVLALARVENGQRVLDVGCGLGGTLERIDAAHEGMLLVGVNIDRRQLSICAELGATGSNRLAWSEADGCELPFAGGRFDRVLCVEAMFHFASRRRFFAEAARVLAPGGVLTVTDMVVDPSRCGPHRAEIARRLAAGYGPWPDPFGFEGTHAALATAAGFDTETSIDATEFTRRSHRFTVPEGCPDHGADPMLVAGRALRELHGAGALTYLYQSYRRRDDG